MVISGHTAKKIKYDSGLSQYFYCVPLLNDRR